MLIDLTQELAQRVRRHQGSIKTARNLYARPVMEPHSQARFAQALPDFLAAYDYTALMAMPWLEGAAQPDAWLETLVRAVAGHPLGLKKTVFELQSVDWNTRKPVPDRHARRADAAPATPRRAQFRLLPGRFPGRPSGAGSHQAGAIAAAFPAQGLIDDERTRQCLKNSA